MVNHLSPFIKDSKKTVCIFLERFTDLCNLVPVQVDQNHPSECTIFITLDLSAERNTLVVCIQKSMCIRACNDHIIRIFQCFFVPVQSGIIHNHITVTVDGFVQKKLFSSKYHNRRNILSGKKRITECLGAHLISSHVLSYRRAGIDIFVFYGCIQIILQIIIIINVFGYRIHLFQITGKIAFHIDEVFTLVMSLFFQRAKMKNAIKHRHYDQHCHYDQYCHLFQSPVLQSTCFCYFHFLLLCPEF